MRLVTENRYEIAEFCGRVVLVAERGNLLGRQRDIAQSGQSGGLQNRVSRRFKSCCPCWFPGVTTPPSPRGTFYSQGEGLPYKDPQKQREYQLQWMLKRRRKWIEENGPCSRCGSMIDLEVDHIDATQKVSHRVWSWSEERCNEELAKCQVLCKSCHDIKTVEAGELAVGSNHGRSKMTEEMVHSAREKYNAGGFTIQDLATQYGVHKSTMHVALQGRTWKS